VQECRVIRISCRDSQELEVAVEFPTAQPEFWTRLEDLGEESESRSASIPASRCRGV